MIQGRGYAIPLALTTGTADDADLFAIVAATDKPLAIGSVQGHYEVGDSSETVSFALLRASASTPGATITPTSMNPDDTAPGFTVTSNPTLVTVTTPASPLAVFGGNGAASYGWYPSVEEHQIILKPADILILRIEIAPTSALVMRATINVTEL